MVLGRLWSFFILIAWEGLGNGFMESIQKLSQERLIYPRLVFIARSYDQTLRL